MIRSNTWKEFAHNVYTPNEIFFCYCSNFNASICFSFAIAIDMCRTPLRFKMLLMALNFWTLTASIRFQHGLWKSACTMPIPKFISHVFFSFVVIKYLAQYIGLILLIQIECNKNNWHLHKCIRGKRDTWSLRLKKNLHNNMSHIFYWFWFVSYT